LDSQAEDSQNLASLNKLDMRILIACEYSGVVRDAFRKKGHDAWSCDILPCDGDETYHYQCDITEVLDRDWDMIIAHPPCNHLAVSGSKYFKQKIADGRQQQGIDFFMQFTKTKCPKVCIENPVGIMSTKWRKPDQIIQPFQFGHPESKKTCLWLIGLPKLVPTNILSIPESGRWENQTKDGQNKLIVDGKWIGFNDKRTAKLRSKTYQGIADAMANQWI
jgi:site-specific DNA-cytosine methylase